jgi:hypothetical protein
MIEPCGTHGYLGENSFASYLLIAAVEKLEMILKSSIEYSVSEK